MKFIRWLFSTPTYLTTVSYPESRGAELTAWLKRASSKRKSNSDRGPFRVKAWKLMYAMFAGRWIEVQLIDALEDRQVKIQYRFVSLGIWFRFFWFPLWSFFALVSAAQGEWVGIVACTLAIVIGRLTMLLSAVGINRSRLESIAFMGS